MNTLRRVHVTFVQPAPLRSHLLVVFLVSLLFTSPLFVSSNGCSNTLNEDTFKALLSLSLSHASTQPSPTHFCICSRNTPSCVTHPHIHFP